MLRGFVDGPYWPTISELMNMLYLSSTETLLATRDDREMVKAQGAAGAISMLKNWILDLSEGERNGTGK